MSNPELEILERWIARRDELERLHASVDGAKLCEDVVNDLEKLIVAREEATVTLTEAAEITGYSTDHLARLVKNGRIRNAGRKYRPLLMLRDLPVRPRLIADTAAGRYDPNTDARSLRARR
jgi:hypothetical protein